MLVHRGALHSVSGEIGIEDAGTGRNLNYRRKRSGEFKQKEAKLAKVEHLSSGRLYFRIRSPKSEGRRKEEVVSLS
jgi:hypothetical protein